MKVYQIFKATGCYEDYHKHVQATYLSKERAENELARLKATVPDCDECPYSEEYQFQPIETQCPHHKPVVVDYYEEDEDLYSCENLIDSYDAPSYSIEEFDVDESEG